MSSAVRTVIGEELGERAIYTRFGDQVEPVLTTMADRYIGEHPQHPPVFRIHRRDGFRRGSDFRYEMDLDAKLEGLRDGQYVYCWAKWWSASGGQQAFSVSCLGPLRVMVNGAEVFCSNLNDDVFPDRRTGFRAGTRPGWNHVVIEFTKTGTGCGGKFGTGSIKGSPLHFLAPLEDREGQEGWVYSMPVDRPVEDFPTGETLYGAEGEGSWPRLSWLPEAQWRPEELERHPGVFARLFGTAPGMRAAAWTRIAVRSSIPQPVVLSGTCGGELDIYTNGRQTGSCRVVDSRFQVELTLPYGVHELLVVSTCPDSGSTGWGFTLDPLPEAQGVCLQPPHQVEGLRDVWLYSGPYPGGLELDPQQLASLERPLEDGAAGTYWQGNLPGGASVRPYLETPLFGRWNYPLGVTLYGLLQTGEALGRSSYTDYVQAHMGQCTAWDAYALWDQEQYGTPGLNHQLCAVDSLDDCGSFGATLLLAMERCGLSEGQAAVDRIADYISSRQERRPDGALYRVHGSTDFMQDTLWCDDLYMSIPFLCRYAGRTGDSRYLDDAARQCLLYREYLWMPEYGIMSHVYDFKFNKQNRIPWGRGNGWVLFSLTELLTVLPSAHEHYEELLAFYRELCAGYLRLQGERGLWHQVLTLKDSYEESSCTSMFLYAYSRGIRLGWLPDEESAYLRSVERGWRGLCERAIDARGNLYGVCRGSGYSFSAAYYRDELSWQLNDTHGIGIVMLAGIEVLKLRQHLARG